MNPSSDMFKKIKSLFIVEDPNSVNNQPESGQTEKQGLPAEVTQAKENDFQATSSRTNGTSDPKFVELLLKAIESSNMEGFDYLEYKNSLKSIESVIPDENVRYKSAFEMAKTMGLTKAKLIESANHYLSVLKSEESKFKDALNNQKTKQIQGRADQLKSVEKAIEDKKKMIEQLTKEIESSTAQLDTVKKDINDAVLKIETTNDQFHASYSLVYGQIQEDVSKITAHIQ
jgi:chromosome segregation ATPase